MGLIGSYLGLLYCGEKEGGREGGVGRENIIFLEVGTYGCQNDGLGELDKMGRREGGREGGIVDNFV